MSFENVTLLLKDFEYSITLCGLLKEQFEVKNLNGEICFLIKTEEIMKFFRNLTLVSKTNLVWFAPVTFHVAAMQRMAI